MQTMNHTPAPVPNNVVILVLATTVLCVEVSICFSGSMLFKKIMKVADRSICSFSSRNWFIDEIINLPGYWFTANAKYATFSRCFEVNGTRLLRIGRIVHLLGVIKGIMHSSLQRTRLTGGEKWNRWMTLEKIFAIINRWIVNLSFAFCFPKVIWMSLYGCNFVLFWSSSTPWYFFSIFLAGVAKISRRLHYFYESKEFVPCLDKFGVTHNCKSCHFSCFFIRSL